MNTCICQKSKSNKYEQCTHNKLLGSTFCEKHKSGQCTLYTNIPLALLPTPTAKPFDFLKSTSSSPTDIWVFTDDENKYFGKVYIMPSVNMDISEGVAYEANVYSYIKKEIIDDVNNPCRKNFIELVKHCKNLTFDDLKLLISNFQPFIDTYNVARNMAYTRCGIRDRPPLTQYESTRHIDRTKLSCFTNAIYKNSRWENRHDNGKTGIYMSLSSDCRNC